MKELAMKLMYYADVIMDGEELDHGATFFLKEAAILLKTIDTPAYVLYHGHPTDGVFIAGITTSLESALLYADSESGRYYQLIDSLSAFFVRNPNGTIPVRNSNGT